MQSENRTALWIVLITAVLVIFIGAVLVLSQNNANQNGAANVTTSTSTSIQTVTTTTSEDIVATEMEFDLEEQNNSGQDGIVTLEELGDQVRVTINVANPAAEAQPAHIHAGRCPDPGAIEFPLQSVVNGTSVTMIDTTLAELAVMGDLAVNVHKSTAEPEVYFACGDLDFLL